MSKGNRLLRLFPKFFKTDSKTTNNVTGDNKGPICYIVFLDDSEQTINYKNNWKGQVLFDQVCELINLSEKIYFGLRFLDTTGQAHWLDLGKSVTSQLKGCSSYPRLYFGVKFYAADPCKLWEEITRYLFFLQVKRDILQGRLPVSFEEAAELCAYAVQSELGDYDPKYHTPGYVSEFSFLPNQTEELEARIAAMHRRCQGATPVMAEQKFLEKVKWLEMYGVDLHPVQDTGNVEYYLGLTPTGIVVFKHRTKIASYFWPRVTKASRKGKIFTIKVKDKNNEEHTYAFELSTKPACKHLWKCCVEHRTFFSGRAERLATYDTKSREEPRVQRAPSRRKARRVNSDSRLNSEPVYQDQYVNGNRSIITVVSQPESVKTPRHKSLPELQGRQSPRSVRSAPWESKLDHGLYTSGHDSPASGRQVSFISVGSDSESAISQRKRYFPSRKSSDNESDASASRRRRREIESDSGSEVSFSNSNQNRRNRFGHRNLKTSDSHISRPYDDKGNSSHGSIPSVHSAPAGEARQRRRRRRSKSPGNTKRPPEELKQHIEFELVDTEGMTEQQLKDITYTKVETKAHLFRIKYSPKFRHKIWASRRKSFGDADKHSKPGEKRTDSSDMSKQDGYNTDPYQRDRQSSKAVDQELLVDSKHTKYHQGVMVSTTPSEPNKGYNPVTPRTTMDQRHFSSEETTYSDSAVRRQRDDNFNFATSYSGENSGKRYPGNHNKNEQNRFSYHEQSRKSPLAQIQQGTPDRYSHLEASGYNQEIRSTSSDRVNQPYPQPNRYSTRPGDYSQSPKQDSYTVYNHNEGSPQRLPGHLSSSYYASVDQPGWQKSYTLASPKYSEVGPPKGFSTLPRYGDITVETTQRGSAISPPRYKDVVSPAKGNHASPQSSARMHLDQWSTPLRPDSYKYEKQELHFPNSGSVGTGESYNGSQRYQNGAPSFVPSSPSKSRNINISGSFQPQFDDRQGKVPYSSSSRLPDSPRRSPYNQVMNSPVRSAARPTQAHLQQPNKYRSDLVTQI